MNYHDVFSSERPVPPTKEQVLDQEVRVAARGAGWLDCVRSAGVAESGLPAPARPDPTVITTITQ